MKSNGLWILHQNTYIGNSQRAPQRCTYPGNPGSRYRSMWGYLGRHRLALGDYTQQGLPMYPWEVSYAKSYEIPRQPSAYKLTLGDWRGTVAQVWVNGKKCASIINPPYEVDLTDVLTPGRNDIEVRVIGSIVNLYGPHYAERAGIMGPWMWDGVKEQRPGTDYILNPYGLTSDFTLLKAE